MSRYDARAPRFGAALAFAMVSPFSSRTTIGSFVVLCVALAVAWLAFARWPALRADVHAKVEHDLTLQAHARAEALNDWFDTRLTDVAMVAHFPTVVRLAASGPQAADPVPEDTAVRMAQVLSSFIDSHRLGAIALVDGQDGVVVAAGAVPEGARCIEHARTLQGHHDAILGVHQHADGTVAAQFVHPVNDGPALVVGEVDIARSLCALAERPLVGGTSVTAAVVHDAGEAPLWMCAGAMRFTDWFDSHDSSRPLDALGAGVVIGPTFGHIASANGRSALGAVQPLGVPGWRIVVSVDHDEVDTEVWARARSSAIATGLPTLAIAGLVVLAWRSRERLHELTLARARARQADLLDRANDAILFITPAGRILDANVSAERLYSRDRSAMVGLHVIDDLRAPEARAVGIAQLSGALESGHMVFETVHLSADGRRIPVEVSSSRVATPEGTNIIVSVVRDIRERLADRQQIMRLNRLLRTRSEINQLLVDRVEAHELLSRACAIAVDEGGFDVAWVGRAAPDGRVCVIASAGRDDLPLGAVEVRWDDSPLGQGPVERALRTHETVVVNDTTADTSITPWLALLQQAGFRSFAACPMLMRGAPFGVLCLVSAEDRAFDAETTKLLDELAADLGFGLEALDDRAQRAATEAALAEQRRLFEEMTELSPVAIYLFDLGLGTNVYSNRAMAGMLGHTRDELAALGPATLAALLHPDDLALAPERIARFATAADGEVVGTEYRMRHRDGEYRWLRSHEIVFAREADGRPKVILGVVEDTTESRRLQAQFLQAQKMEGIGRLAGGVAHDFNNLLTAIMGYAELLRAQLPPDDETRSFVDEIASAGSRAAALTAQLLAFARRQVIEPKPVDLNAVVGDAERMLRRLVGEDVEMLTLLAAPLGLARADANQLQQVLVNLVVNARDAMPHGGRLVIETANVTLDEHYASQHVQVIPGDYVTLAVSDTGIGISPEVASHIFEPFFTTKDPGKGTGLGLATCHGIVTQSGGHIGLYSEPGLGTTFRVYLPRLDGVAPEEAVVRLPPLRGGHETVLLVEDDDAVRELAALGLRSNGYRVLDASNGREAIEIASAYRDEVALLITDTVMPGMGGRQVADEVGRLCPRARVLFMSGHADAAIAHHGVLDEGVAFLAKPFTPERIARRVREVLDAAPP